MLGTREKRQAAIAAARARNNPQTRPRSFSSKINGMTSRVTGRKEARTSSPTSEVRTKNTVPANTNTSRFRRSRSQSTAKPPGVKEADDRRQDDKEKLNGRERIDFRNDSKESLELSRPQNFGQAQSKNRARLGDCGMFADKTQIFGGGDKRQKKIVYRAFSEKPLEVIQLVVEEPPLPCNEGEVVIKISASTVSQTDCMKRRGIFFDITNPTDLPATPGMDVVGNIIAVGPEVNDFKVGDRVATLVRLGGNARYITALEEDLVLVPRSCDSAEAVCMVSTYMTAYQALRIVTKDTFLLTSKRILITGGIEPVGQALIQLCFRAGAEKVYATAPEHRHRYIKNVLGAQPLTVDPTSWLDTVQGSMDVVFDGTCYDSLESPSASLKSEGTLMCLGMSSLLRGEEPGVFGAPISAYWAKFKGQMMSNTKSYEVWESFIHHKEDYKLDLEILFHLLKKRFIKPHIAKRIALSEVAEAHLSLEEETARGEIVCLPWKRLLK